MTLVPPLGPDDHLQGSEDARVQLVEYGDYQCPFCRRAHAVVSELVKELGPAMVYAWRHFPLTQAHPHAALAAEAAEAAAAQGHFWDMHNELFRHQDQLGPRLPRYLATRLRLDLGRFDEDLRSGHLRERVRRDFMSGVRSGVAGTPGFFIDGRRHDGSWDLETLRHSLRARLEGRETHAP
jgi:protein-disulfide isomerase